MPSYRDIIAANEQYLALHGDTHAGVGWVNPTSLDARYKVMLDIIREPEPRSISLLDFGCGTSLLWEHIVRTGVSGVDYTGLDASEKFLAVSRQKYPGNRYIHADLMQAGVDIGAYDYAVLNGVFTSRVSLSHDAMKAYVTELLQRVFARVRKGVAFNVHTRHVDWTREDLFYMPFDETSELVVKALSRHFVIRHDYGLHEYTVYVYQKSNA